MPRPSFNVDFDRAPLLVIWETTRACALACRHCRAAAIDQRHPDELTTDEGKRLLDEVRGMGTPLIIFTGGDPLQRSDLETLIAHAKALDLRVGAIPATTERLTHRRVASLKRAGLDQMAVSLDGSTPELHDGFRQVPGCFDKVMQAAEWAREVGLPLQINTVFAAWNATDFDPLAALVRSLGTVFWEVFFLVPTGRGAEMNSATVEQFEQLFARLHACSRTTDMIVKVTDAPQYRVYVRMQDSLGTPDSLLAVDSPEPAFPASGRKQAGGLRSPASLPSHHHAHRGRAKRALSGVNAGKGFCFVDHLGNVQPSGFLPLTAGNVRDRSLAEIYCEHPLFLELRNADLLKGMCGACEHRELCGGSRARAYAMTGDYLAAEPFCRYGPATG